MTWNMVYLCKCSLYTWKECLFCYCAFKEEARSVLTTSVKLPVLMAYLALTEPPCQWGWEDHWEYPRQKFQTYYFYSIFSSFSSINPSCCMPLDYCHIAEMFVFVNFVDISNCFLGRGLV